MTYLERVLGTRRRRDSVDGSAFRLPSGEWLVLVMIIGLGLTMPTHGGEMRASPNFSIRADGVTAGGGSISSAGFQMTAAVGASIEGASMSSGSFSLSAGIIAVANSSTPNDTDGDGLPNSYETANGLNPNNPTDASIDSDGDGKSNFQEFLAGTNLQVDEAAIISMISGVLLD